MARKVLAGATWRILVAGCVVTFALLAAVLSLETRTQTSWEEAYRLGQLDAEVNRLSALEWEMIAAGGVSDESYEAYLQRTDNIDTMITALSENGGEQELPVAYRRYHDAMADEIVALSRGDVAAAREVDEARVDPSFEALNEAIQEEVGSHTSSAEETGGLVRTGTIFAILGAALIAGVLVLRHESSVRAFALSLEAKVRERTRELHVANERLELLYRDARHLADTDSLTGLLNHRQFQEKVQQAVSGVQGSGECLALILMDVDHFKSINDTMGHQEGDRILISIAQTLRSTDSTSLVFRPGGDEFAVLIRGLDGGAAAIVAERLRLAISTAQAQAGVTVSAGVAVLNEQGANPQELIHNADAALYRAKALGRNRVIVCDDSFHDATENDSGDHRVLTAPA